MFLRCNRDLSVGYQNFIMDCAKVNIGPTAAHSLEKEMVDKEGHLTGLFWTDATGQTNYDVFGGIISFDPTFRTNRYNMVFVPFTRVYNHWRTVTFAAGLIIKENYKNFKWLLNTFNVAMGRVPPCVITDQCLAIKKALAKH
ncbi:hypothetical protein POM88_049175 [Heracleum sosnowskyi]|uniref:MULE transposase domain-containing protein n=1 Tax=Heracleum sosnowskyi TaxID=360622 RepID=A0AAD8GXE7_9APIA|nr:hypothetical protein POM88_049175 [Heracleum sosnowskyi]